MRAIKLLPFAFVVIIFFLVEDFPAFKGAEGQKETVIYLEKEKKDVSRDGREKPEEGNCQININQGNKEELQELTGIGPVYAKKIKEKRPFSDLRDLLEIDGIGEKTLESIKTQDCGYISSSK